VRCFRLAAVRNLMLRPIASRDADEGVAGSVGFDVHLSQDVVLEHGQVGYLLRWKVEWPSRPIVEYSSRDKHDKQDTGC
jgi:hypothetical protein